MMAHRITLALPSKGRLMERSVEIFRQAGLTIEKNGHERGYLGTIREMPEVDIAFMSASEIAFSLRTGRIHMGITGEDLVREYGPQTESHVVLLRPLGFGRADVVVAVPGCWIDVNEMADLENIAGDFGREHGRPMRVATKYMNLTRRFFAERGVSRYRIVESLGATEGTPAAGSAEIVVDITSTGATLEANHLKVLADGLILSSQACLFASRGADWPPPACAVRNDLIGRLATGH
ncbi:MAG: ATP phosphoribosyltransferase [Hyphomicrobiaceae bacterium]